MTVEDDVGEETARELQLKGRQVVTRDLPNAVDRRRAVTERSAGKKRLEVRLRTTPCVFEVSPHLPHYSVNALDLSIVCYVLQNVNEVGPEDVEDAPSVVVVAHPRERVVVTHQALRL